MSSLPPAVAQHDRQVGAAQDVPPPNVLLLAVPFMPSFGAAAALLLARHALSQMEVPPCQAYTMALVAPEERPAAAGLTAGARALGQAGAPVVSGLTPPATPLPFLLAGGLTIVYNLSLFFRFRSVPLDDPSHRPARRLRSVDRSRRIDHTRRMRRRLGRAPVATALLALAASWATGWAVAFHLASDDHSGRASSDDRGALGLEMAAHDHVHAAGKPAHGHPVVGGVAAPMLGRFSLMAPAMPRQAPEGVFIAAPSRRVTSHAGSNHGPLPRGGSVSVLRI